jgi:hypothetical protein
MKYSKGICWIGDCKIPFEDTQNPATNPKYRLEGNYKMPEKGQISEGSITKFQSSLNEIDVKGRFTPNLLVCDDMLNDGNITKKSNPKITPVGIGRGVIGNHDGRKTIIKAKEGMEMLRSVGDGGSNSRFYDLDKWFDKLIDSL